MIHLLDTDTINKIAAGEVIERPASVVKELVENAVDAGADRISVEIENGGMTLIRVSDNGSGIEKADIKKAFVKHATSKISAVEDLTGVATLGFRGEALSSIAAVAKVTLLTKTHESMSGFSYGIEAGEETAFEETGIPDGTTVVVRDLFFNTPVRKKFLKSESAEGAAAGTVMEHMALSRPDISFRFVNNGKEKLSTTGNGNLKEVIYSLYGREITGNLIDINDGNDEVKISGFIGKPAISRGNRSFENYAVNGRYIKNDSVSSAIEEAYKGYIMLHNYPFTALLFEIDPGLLDVNVHPAKRELRLTASESVCAFITEALKKRISGTDIVPEVVPGKDSEKHTQDDSVFLTEEVKKTPLFVSEVRKEYGVENDTSVLAHKVLADTDYANHAEGGESEDIVQETSSQGAFTDPAKDMFSKDMVREVASHGILTEAAPGNSLECMRSNGSMQEISGNSASLDTGQAASTSDTPRIHPASYEQQEIPGVRESNKYRLLGHLFATYWLIEAEDTFYMMDQHAAHEKILYERLMKKVSQKSPQTQYLTVPVVLECGFESAGLLEPDSDIFDSFTQLGYEIEPFGDKSLKITGIPAGLPMMDYRQMLTDVIDSLSDKKDAGISPSDTPQIMIEKIASMSCKAAIKGNDRISGTEALELISEMMEADNPFNCPHGRPTLIAMTKYEIEKKFKRIV